MSDAVDWWGVMERSNPITIRVPSGQTAEIIVTRYSGREPTMADVVGTGPPPW